MKRTSREQQAQNRRWNKLNPALVIEARALSQRGHGPAEIARLLGVQCDHSTIALAVAGKTWKNVPMEA